MNKEFLEKIDAVIAEGPFTDSWESLEGYRVPAWYENAKFGIFIHWGIFSVPAFRDEWYARRMYTEGTDVYLHHLQTYGTHDKFGYKDFIPMFKAEKFDPQAWSALFKESGARYVIPVAEFHDGFQMYDSGLSEWNAFRMGPKRDVIGELAKAVRNEGLIFGVSSHRAENWWFYDEGMKFDSDVRDPKNRGLYGPARTFPITTHTHSVDREFLEDWLMRTCELVDKYRPQVVYFDLWIQNMSFKPYLKKFAAYYYNRAAEWDRGVVINYKDDAYPAGIAVYDVERGQTDRIRGLFWQSDTSMSENSWGYISGHRYKSASDILNCLIDVVSKNGTLLLNTGPMPDGTIPLPEQEILRKLGNWLKLNGEAIYGTHAWKVYGEGPTKVKGGPMADRSPVEFTSEDIRFTAGEGVLYAILFKWPENGIVKIKSLGFRSKFSVPHISGIGLLYHKAPVQWTCNSDELSIRVDGLNSIEDPVVLKIDLH